MSTKRSFRHKQTWMFIWYIWPLRGHHVLKSLNYCKPLLFFHYRGRKTSSIHIPKKMPCTRTFSPWKAWSMFKSHVPEIWWNKNLILIKSHDNNSFVHHHAQNSNMSLMTFFYPLFGVRTWSIKHVFRNAPPCNFSYIGNIRRPLLF